MYIKENLNPKSWTVGDCVIRAISKVLNQPWEKTYNDLCDRGMELKDMPSANHVWGSYLRDNGFKRYSIPNYCPDCYTVREFTEDNPYGVFVVCTGSHVVAVIDGNFFDTWYSGDEIPTYYFELESEDR